MSTLFEPHNSSIQKEICNLLYEKNHTRIERIVSNGQPSPQGFWYDQSEEEWVCLLEGTATLQFEEYSVEMKKGDYIQIPPQVKHRVEKVSLDAIWLAVYMK